MGPQQLQAPRRSLAAFAAALVRALLLRAARGRWLAARAAAAHAPQRRRAAPARRGPQLLLAVMDPLCLLTLRNPRRRRRRGRAAAFARCLFLVVPAYRPHPATNPHRSLRTLRRGSESGLILLLRGPRSMRWARQPTRRSRRRQRGRFRARRAAPSRTALPLLANLAPPTTRLPSGRLSRRLRRRHGTRRAALGLGRLWTLCRNRGRDVATEGRSYGLAPRRCRTRRGGRSW